MKRRTMDALFGAHAGSFSQYLIGVSIPFYLLFLLYFLLAFFLYATLFAGLASLVKRQEEIQSVIMLPLLLMSSGYVLFFFVIATPDATRDEGAVVHSVLDPDVDADASCLGHGRLVGDRRNGRLDAADHSGLHLVCRAPVSLRRPDVRAAAWPWSPAETGADALTVGEGGDLSQMGFSLPV